MWIALALILVVALAAFLLVVSWKPDTFRWERQTVINAPLEAVFPLIDDFHAWRAWSPWEELDPNLERVYSGPDRGRGASYAWQGNRKAGKGRMEIQSSTPSGRVVIALDFLEPFKAHNVAEFTLTPEGTGTRVTWTMSGKTPFMNKLMSTFMNFEAMVMKDFEKGLAQMKAAAER